MRYHNTTFNAHRTDLHYVASLKGPHGQIDAHVNLSTDDVEITITTKDGEVYTKNEVIYFELTEDRMKEALEGEYDKAFLELIRKEFSENKLSQGRLDEHSLPRDVVTAVNNLADRLDKLESK